MSRLSAAGDQPISAGQRWIIAAVLIAAAVLGVFVENRSAFLTRRMTDLGCYLRAAWAVRTGADPYAVTEQNGWHYNYPHLLAVALGPLAEPPPGAAPILALPWAISVAVWYSIGVLAAFAAVHWLAAAVDAGMSEPPRRFGYVWWSHRLVPLVVALPMIGRTVARGQANTVVLALLAGWLVAAVRGRRVTGGACLALAACLKVIPALLFLHPLWRRDRRTLAGGILGLTFGLVAVPLLACGPAEAVRQTRTFLAVAVSPGLGLGGDDTRAVELTNANTGDSQSLMTVLHNLNYPDPAHRPTRFAPWVRPTHWLGGGLLILVTLGTVGRRPATPANEVAFAGALCVVMTLVSPVNHLHYFVFAAPLITAIWCACRRRATVAVLSLFGIVSTISLLPIYWPGTYAMPIREYGFTTAAALLLWACVILSPGKEPMGQSTFRTEPVSQAA